MGYKLLRAGVHAISLPGISSRRRELAKMNSKALKIFLCLVALFGHLSAAPLPMEDGKISFNCTRV